MKSQVPEKKRHIWLWVLGWIGIFPLPLTILLVRKRNLNAVIKYGAMTTAWLFYLMIVMAGMGDDSAEQASDMASVEKIVQEETTENLVPESEMESFETVKNSQDDASTEITESSQDNASTETTESSQDNAFTETEKESIASKEIRNETLNGRGSSDSGRSEPDYKNVIGYVAISSSQEYEISHTDQFEDTGLWSIPTYEKDKQFWNETEVTLPHKTEVVVKEQYLKHEGYGAYSGYLLVEKREDGQQYYIDVGNYITKPYWDYKNELLKAASTGCFVAEYHQVSDYYPVDNGGDKVELEDGMRVLVTGTAGLSRYINPSDTGIKAEVWKEWKYGYGGVTVYFNEEDLTIIY